MRFARPAAAAGLLGVVTAADALISRVDLPVPLLAPVDWTGHLATTGIALLAVGPKELSRHARTLGIVAVSSVAIDVDHVPLYLHLIDPVNSSRPVTHSLLTPGVLLVAGLVDRRHRRDLYAVATGVVLHLVRDVATGPGVALLAPFADSVTRLPWTCYGAVLAALVAVAAVREWVTSAARPAQPPAGAAPPRASDAGRRPPRARSRSAAGG